MARSASPSWATPTSAPASTTARATTSGTVAPTPSLMFHPSGRSLIGRTEAPSLRRMSGATRDAAPWAQSTTTRRPGPRILGHDVLDLLLHLVGELVSGSAEELDAVVLGGVVRSGDDRSRLCPEVGREKGDGRCGAHPEQDRVTPRRADAGGEGGLEELSRGTRVPADGDVRPAHAGLGQRRNRGASEAAGELGGKLAVGDPPNPVGPEQPSHDSAILRTSPCPPGSQSTLPQTWCWFSVRRAFPKDYWSKDCWSPKASRSS